MMFNWMIYGDFQIPAVRFLFFLNGGFCGSLQCDGSCHNLSAKVRDFPSEILSIHQLQSTDLQQKTSHANRNDK